MELLWPWAFALLVPWGAAVYFAWRSAVAPASVPFLPLWSRTGIDPDRRRLRLAPPVWILLLLGAALTLILAAARPVWRGTHAGLTLVVDCRLSLSPPDRFASALAGLHLRPGDRVRVVPSVGEPFTLDRAPVAGDIHFTADPSEAPLVRQIHHQLDATPGPVYVLTDQPPASANPRVEFLHPTLPLRNAGIDRFAITPGPHPQAMVRVFNGTSAAHAMLRVGDASQSIELPPTGQTRDYFLPLTALSEVAEARLILQPDAGNAIAPNAIAPNAIGADAIAADNTAFLVRTRGWPRIDVRCPIPAPMQRMIDVYTRHRSPPAALASGGLRPEEGTTVTIVARPEDAVGPVVVRPLGSLRSLSADEPLSVDEKNPVTQGVDWTAIPQSARVAPLPDGWRAVVRRGEMPLVAVRDDPPGVWTTIDDADWAQHADYVIFWTNVFDTLTQGAPQYTAEPVGRVRGAVALRRSDDAVIDAPGVYAVPSPDDETPDNGTPEQFATAMPAVRGGGTVADAKTPGRENIATSVPLGRYTLGAALVLLMLALAWRDA
ncbi:MAG: hypothetical protein ACTHLZ_05215 [Tepidisphaeraceae bacterium]